VKNVFSKIFKKLKRASHRKNTPKGLEPGSADRNLLSKNLNENIKMLDEIFDRCSDVIKREFKMGIAEDIKCLAVAIDGMQDRIQLYQDVFKNLQISVSLIPQSRKLAKSNAFDLVKNHLLTIGEVRTTAEMTQLIFYVMMGDAALLIDGSSEAIICSLRKWDARAVEEPSTEPLIRGPREGFTESLRTNTALVRRRIKTPRLKMERLHIGALTKTDVIITYIDGIANDKVVEEVRRRLKRIKTDGILESGNLEDYIEDQTFTIFPQANTTERPDKLAANLLEGYVGIITDNTPMALIVPGIFINFLQSSEDYYNRFTYSTFIRLLRFIALNISLLLPSFYIAIVTYHQEMLPTPLLISIASQREGVPFPAFVEALLMESIFEILREAGIRLPRAIGQAISIVGALVIGEAAVNAGLASSAMVMVVSLTAIASFSMPTIATSQTIRLLRFPIMFLAGSLGLFGVMAGLMAVLIHLCSLRSFGVPYLSPFTPLSFRDLKDTFIRVPQWAMHTRPRSIGYKEPQRQEYGQAPGPEHGGRSRNEKGDEDGT
jgi:spore germination protein KA